MSNIVEKVAEIIDANAFKLWNMAYAYEFGITSDVKEAAGFADWAHGNSCEEARSKAKDTIRAVLEHYRDNVSDGMRSSADKAHFKGGGSEATFKAMLSKALAELDT